MSEFKLHLGCGKKYIPGFVHIDKDNYSHIDYHCDIKKLFMFKDETVNLIFCSHSLQYFDREEAKKVLTEWYRVLKHGGILRLAVPDFEAIVAVYHKYNDIEYLGILGPLFGKMKIKSSSGEEIIYHKTVYDFNSLKKMLESVRFKNVRRYDWRETEHRDYDDYSQSYVPHRDKENGILISLNMEGKK